MAMTENEMDLFKDLLGTLKDLSTYLEKAEMQDTTQTTAKLPDAPIARETQDPITGGAAASNSPGAGIVDDSASKAKGKTLTSGGKTMLKAEDADKDDVEEVSDDETSESETSESSEGDEEELKSILKEIRNELAKSQDNTTVIKAEIKKAVPQAVDKMLRQMGYNPTRPDVSRIDPSRLVGLDSTSEVKKSEDSESEIKPDLVKSDEDAIKEAVNPSKSFRELGQLREKLGLFKAF